LANLLLTAGRGVFAPQNIPMERCTSSLFAQETVLTKPSQTDDVLKVVKASCITPEFDMFSKGGVGIDGAFYMDGGIAISVPQTHLDKKSAMWC
jgi:predicted patatin/cPLA2 family phospholipase